MGTMTTLGSALAATSPPFQVPSWLWIIGSAATLLISSGLVGQLVTSAIARLRESAAVRREKYANAVALLTAWVEYPYRIRRRTNDDPDTIAALAERGHQLQEEIAAMRAWIATESPAVGEVFTHHLAQLDEPFKQACRQAWESAPITAPAGMNLNGFGLDGQQSALDALECAAAYRFGISRLLPASKLRKRLQKAGCLPR